MVLTTPGGLLPAGAEASAGRRRLNAKRARANVTRKSPTRSPAPGLGPESILASVNDGVYATDRERRIVYWSRSAERITGWRARDVMGKSCSDDILCHEDKDGNRLCGEEHCPLHRSIISGKASCLPIIVFAQSRSGGRIPLRVSVAPIRDASGESIGGVETFRDISTEMADIQRVKRIQSLSLQRALPEDPRIRFAVHSVPHDIIGGDFYAVARLDDDRFGFLLADVSGHGVPAALYTMYLGSLWETHRRLLDSPARFALRVNTRLHGLVGDEGAFAAGVCGVFDLKRKRLRFAGAGNPPPLLARGGGFNRLDCSGMPLGCSGDAAYDEREVELRSGDCLLLFTDGATEITRRAGGHLEVQGLMKVLRDIGYPGSNAGLNAIERELLVRSNRIRFDDDLTFLEARIV
jgi:phosphoserine phosphatase RsbU/P